MVHRKPLHLFCLPVIAAVQLAGANAFTIAHCDNGTLKVHAEITDTQSLFNQTSGRTIPTLSGTVHTNAPGEPDLPTKTLNLTGPSGQWESTITNAVFDTLDNIDIPSTPIDVPAYGELPTAPALSAPGQAYTSNAFWPNSLINMISGESVHGTEISHVRISPFRYNPVTKQLIYPRTIDLTISTTGAWSPTTDPVVQMLCDDQKNTSASTPRSRASEPTEGMICILTVDSLLPAADRLSEWHQLNGFRSEIASWPGNVSSSMVTSKIAELFASAGNQPKYLVILGNSGMIPQAEVTVQEYQTSPLQGLSDMQYGNLEGDWFPEIVRGRVPVNTVQQAEQYVSKLIDAWYHPSQNDGFYKRITAAAQSGEYSNAFGAAMTAAADQLTAKQYDVTRVIVPSADAGTTTSIIDNINAGTLVAMHYDHGLSEGWSTPSFRIKDLGSLTNKNEYPLVFSINCLSGHYDLANYIGYTNDCPWPYTNPMYDPKQTCFAESLLYVQDGGATSVIAASNLTYVGPNTSLLLKLVNNGIAGKTSTKEWNRVGDLLDASLAGMRAEIGSDNDMSVFHCKIYQLFGDPITPYYLQKPDPLEIQGGFSSDGNGLEISTSTAVEQGKCIVYNSRNKSVCGIAEIAGTSCSIPFTTAPESGDTLKISVISPTTIPSVSTIVSGGSDSVTTTRDMGSAKKSIAIQYSAGNLNISGIGSNCLLSVYSMSGQKLAERAIAEDGGISLKEVAPQILIVKIQGERIALVRKVSMYK